MDRVRALAVLAILLALVACQAPPSPPGSPSPTPSASVAVDPGTPALDAVVAAFADHSVVAIGEQHGSTTQHEFMRAVVADERLTGVLDVIVVEFGSARHQRTLDRYLAGENVPPAELELVWTDTTQRSGVWDAPVYRQFYEFIRELNGRREPEDAPRVVLGDPPIDWSRITHMTNCDDREPTCLDHWVFRRGQHFARLVEEAVAEGHQVLAIAGSGHIRRNPDIDHPVSTVDRLDAALPGAVWAIVPAEVMSPEIRALVGTGAAAPIAHHLAGTPLGALRSDLVFARGTVTCDPGPCETPGPAPRLETVADALLLL
jgi:uncharacterized iron-regulated protein